MYVMMYIVGTIPSIEEANRREGIVTLPWQEKSLELGMFQRLGAICVYFLFKYLTAYITNSKSGLMLYHKAGSHCVWLVDFKYSLASDCWIPADLKAQADMWHFPSYTCCRISSFSSICKSTRVPENTSAVSGACFIFTSSLQYLDSCMFGIHISVIISKVLFKESSDWMWYFLMVVDLNCVENALS